MANTRSSKARSADTGRYVSKAEASAAARVRVTVDKKRGKPTPRWVTTLAQDR